MAFLIIKHGTNTFSADLIMRTELDTPGGCDIQSLITCIHHKKYSILGSLKG